MKPAVAWALLLVLVLVLVSLVLAAARPRREGMASLVYAPPFTRCALAADGLGFWRFGAPPAAARPAPGDPGFHTYRMPNALFDACGACGGPPADVWRLYGGPRGWAWSPYN